MPGPPSPKALVPCSTRCTLCGARGWPTIQIFRSGPLPSGVTWQETAIVCRRHLVAELNELPARTRELAVLMVWDEIDERNGHRRAAVRVPTVRRKELGARSEKTSTRSSILAPRSLCDLLLKALGFVRTGRAKQARKEVPMG